MTQISGWNKGDLLQSPFFAPLHPVFAQLDALEFPGLNELNFLLTTCRQPVVTASGKPLRFVAQVAGILPFEHQYEPRCFLHGEVQTREHNWHDLLNALVWMIFPKAKAAINLRHYQALLESRAPADSSRLTTSQRGAARDVNTLLDESGVVVACADRELSGLLNGFRWKELFWRRRARVQESMGFYLLGHGLYQKALHPYTGMTGQGLVLAVEQNFFDQPLEYRVARLDGLLAGYLNAPQLGRSTRELSPVPLLGVPGWTAENTRDTYYDNAAYFRAGRLR